MEEDLAADLVVDLGEGQVVAQVEGLVAEVEVKAHAVLVNQEVSGTEELLEACTKTTRNLVHG